MTNSNSIENIHHSNGEVVTIPMVTTPPLHRGNTHHSNGESFTIGKSLAFNNDAGKVAEPISYDALRQFIIHNS